MSQTIFQLMQATANAAPVPMQTSKWGTVHMRPLLASDLENIDPSADDKAAEGKKGNPHIRAAARTVARMLCDESGKLSFDADKAEHIELLMKQPWALLQELINAGSKLNGVEEAKNG